MKQATKFLIAANVVALAAIALHQPSALLVPARQLLIDSGANVGLLTISGEFWRVVTYQFIHVGLLHLAINMYALMTVGPIAEEVFGKARFILIYMLAGIAGALATAGLDPMLVSAGASASIFGVYAALIANLVATRRERSPALLKQQALIFLCIIAANAIYGHFVPGIDNAAHAGGLLFGLLAGFTLSTNARRGDTAVGITAILAILICLAGYSNHVYEQQRYGDYQSAVKAAKQDNYDKAAELFSKFLERNPNNMDAHLTRGLVLSKAGRLNEAFDDFSRAIEIDGTVPEAFNSRAWVSCGLRRYESALHDVNKAINLNPKSAACHDTRGVALIKLGKIDSALKDFARANELDPKDAAAYYHRGQLYLQMSQIDKATDDLARGRAYKPDSWETM